VAIITVSGAVIVVIGVLMIAMSFTYAGLLMAGLGVLLERRLAIFELPAVLSAGHYVPASEGRHSGSGAAVLTTASRSGRAHRRMEGHQ
jgi:hypothetical protein